MNQNKKKTIIASIMLICVILWSFVIFGFSNMDAEESDKASYQTVADIITNNLDFTNKIGATHSDSSSEEIIKAAQVINPLMRKIAHFTEYFILAVLLIIFVNYVAKWKISTKGVYKFIYIFLSCLLICTLYATSDEFHQVFIDGRTGQVVDACIDTTGAFFGLIFYTTYHLAYKAGEKSKK